MGLKKAAEPTTPPSAYCCEVTTPLALRLTVRCLSKKLGERLKSRVPRSYFEVSSVPCWLV